MKSEELKALKKLRADLMLQVNALDSAIAACERMNFADDVVTAVVEETKPVQKGRTRNTTFESSIDLTQLNAPEAPWTCPKCGAFNPAGSSTCMECKAKKPARKGIRKD